MDDDNDTGEHYSGVTAALTKAQQCGSATEVMPLQVGKRQWSRDAGKAVLSSWRSHQQEQTTSSLLELTLCCIIVYDLIMI